MTEMTEDCRFCGGATCAAFTMRILRRYDVMSYRCLECASLQVERPYWLHEAYSSAIAAMDTGAVERNLVSQTSIWTIAEILRLRGQFLDFGGGTGMLCRLLRDRGYDAYVYDKYAESAYAKAYSIDLTNQESGTIDLLSAIEVFEHFDEPAAQLAQLFAIRPRVLVATTIPYSGEGADWWYLSPETGQHVFFYSRRALKQIADKFGYDYCEAGAFHIFTHARVDMVRKVLMRCALSAVGRRLGRMWIATTQSGRYANDDYRKLVTSVREWNSFRSERETDRSN